MGSYIGAMGRLDNQVHDNNSFEYAWTKMVYMDSAVLKEMILIRKGMTAKFTNTILVTSTKWYPAPDFIQKALSIEDKKVKLQHTWMKTENSKVMWSGSIAIYKNFSNLKKAADYIVRNFKDIQVIWFPDFINLLASAERSHKLFRIDFSRVIIKGRRSFEKVEFSNFEKKLRAFGELKDIEFLKGTTEFGNIAVAEYRFVTHAFVAKFHLNGLVHSKIGILHAEVVMTDKEKSVQKEVVRRFADYVNSSS